MTLIIPDFSKQTILRYVLNNLAPENFILKLYVNDITPSDSDINSTYTEMTTGNYSSIALTSASWVYTNVAPIEATYPQITWTFSGAIGTLVYGYYVIGQTSNKLIWAERLDTAPFNIFKDGAILKIIPKLRITQ